LTDLPPLQTGVNQITVLGLTPTVDEHSIKVEGTGSAIISDITVELLPNRDIFEEIYPDSDADSDDSDSEAEDDDETKEDLRLEEVQKKLTVLRDEKKAALEKIASAESRLKILDAYGKTLDRKRNVEIDDGLEKYRTEREKVFQDHMDGTVRDRDLIKQITTLSKEETRLFRIQVRAEAKEAKVKAKAAKAKAKEKAKQQRRDAEKAKEKARIRKERESFWPRQCYSIRITLEAASFTPMSSRRNSIASSIEITKVTSEKAPAQPSGEDDVIPTCDISLSYVTASAFWSPSYDLQLSTTSNTAMLCFDARLTNTTSESWTNCKVILSTSQTTFSGLNDAIPSLVPWRVKLAKGHGYDSILNSHEEVSHKGAWQVQQYGWAVAQRPRAQLFGVGGDPSLANEAERNRGGYLKKSAPPQVQQVHQQIQQQMPMRSAALFSNTGFGQPQQATRGGLFGAAASSAFASNALPPPAPGAIPQAFAKKAKAHGGGGGSMGRRKGDYEDGDGEGGGSEDEEEDDEGADEATILGAAVPELEFQESAFEETGLTATYDLPGLKTLIPSLTASKQRVARVSFANVVFSHIIVAKYKPVAFLKARLRNASKLTLLKGEAGLTLDGSFMGRSTLPRCSAGDTFTMSLGIDPAIKVAYPKPDVRRATKGIMSKEETSVYKRVVTIHNTRATAAKPVTLQVLDQVPVSEDEKLRISLLQPRGLVVGGAGATAGSPAKDDGKDWGRATATLKKAGEVCWDVTLQAGRGVKLGLEYEVALPLGEGVTQC